MKQLALFFMPLLLFAFSEDLTLKKDEFVYYQVGDRDLLFRWTLFHNQALIFIVRYDGFSHQGVLYDTFKLNSFRIYVSRQDVSDKEDPYCDFIFKRCTDIYTCSFKLICKDANIKKITGQE